MCELRVRERDRESGMRKGATSQTVLGSSCFSIQCIWWFVSGLILVFIHVPGPWWWWWWWCWRQIFFIQKTAALLLMTVPFNTRLNVEHWYLGTTNQPTNQFQCILRLNSTPTWTTIFLWIRWKAHAIKNNFNNSISIAMCSDPGFIAGFHVGIY